MTMTASPPPEPPGLLEVLIRLCRSWIGIVLALLLFASELANFGMLPAILKSVEAKTTAATSATEQAKASVAKIREDARAAEATESARVKSGQALYADRFRKAEARYLDGHAKVLREKAINTAAFKEAETRIKQQTAFIENEKARHEERRARAEAETTAARAQITDLEEKARLATIRADVINTRLKALRACMNSLVANDPDAVAAATDSCTIGGSCNSRTSERLFRARCLPQIR